jgi:hypothetical protein
MDTLSHLAVVRTTIPWIVAALLSLGATRADEGVWPNGQRVDGELNTDGQTRLHFQPLGQKPSLLLDQLDHVCFPPHRLPPLRAGAAYRVLLRGEQQLTGELLGLDADKVQLRTTWKERLSIPRAAVAAVEHAPGFVTVFVDDFESDLKSWQRTGTPGLTTKQHVSGRRSLCLDGPGQGAEFTLPLPLTAGRAGINFCASAQPTRLAWQIEAEFAGSVGWPVLRVGLDLRAGTYTAEVFGAGAANGHLPRKEGWQRLHMEFSLDALVLSIDDDVLWFCRQAGSGGALRKVCLSCRALPLGNGENGPVFFDDFSLARAIPERSHPKGVPTEDELWLLSGDQLFGTVTDATGGRIQLRAGFGPRTMSWSEVRGIYFRQADALTRKPDCKTVRVWLRSGVGFEPDVLDGTVRSLDPHCLVLSHQSLGELEIDRKRLHRMRSHSDPW